VTDTNVIKLAQPGTFTDSLTEILRNGAHALLAQPGKTAAPIVGKASASAPPIVNPILGRGLGYLAD
jgi:hypothetical protein